MLGSNGETKGQVARYAGTAKALAPVVRRLASDAELRDDLRVVLQAGRKLYDDLSTDEPLSVTRRIFTDAEVRKQIDRALAERGAAEGVGLRAHERLGEALDHLAQEIGLHFGQLLAQPGQQVHVVADHCLLLAVGFGHLTRMEQWSPHLKNKATTLWFVHHGRGH